MHQQQHGAAAIAPVTNMAASANEPQRKAGRAIKCRITITSAQAGVRESFFGLFPTTVDACIYAVGRADELARGQPCSVSVMRAVGRDTPPTRPAHPASVCPIWGRS